MYWIVVGCHPSFDLTKLSAAYVNTYSKRDQTGAYAQDQISIGRLQLIASGRHDWDDQITLNEKNGSPTMTGTRQPGTPKYMASTFVSYDVATAVKTVGPLSGLNVGVGVRYVAGSDGTTSYAVINNVTTFWRFHTDGFVLVDALLGYNLGKAVTRLERWSLSVNVANLFDKKHISACPFATAAITAHRAP